MAPPPRRASATTEPVDGQVVDELEGATDFGTRPLPYVQTSLVDEFDEPASSPSAAPDPPDET